MKKAGFSHAFGTIVTMIVGAAITEYLKKYFPGFFNAMENLGILISKAITNTTGINIPPIFFVPMFVIFVLAFLWGIIYHLLRK